MRLFVVLLLIFAAANAQVSDFLTVSHSQVSVVSSVPARVIFSPDSSLLPNQGIRLYAKVVGNTPGASATTLRLDQLLRQSSPGQILITYSGSAVPSGGVQVDTSASAIFGPSVITSTLAAVCLSLLLLPKSPALTAVIIALALPLLVYSQAPLPAGMLVEVEIKYSPNTNLERLSIRLTAAGSEIRGTPVRSSVLELNTCAGAASTVEIANVNAENSLTVCSSGSVKAEAVSLTSATLTSIDVSSMTSSASVTLKGSFNGSYTISSTSGAASASILCLDATVNENTPSKFSVDCGSATPVVQVSAAQAASLALTADSPAPPPFSIEPDPPVNAKRWSDPATWGGSVPVDGQNVTIAAGLIVLLDTTTAALGELDILGALVADSKSDFWLRASNINVRGSLRVGSALSPYARLGRFTLNGAKGNYTSRTPLMAFRNDGVSRSLRVFPGAKFELYGQPPATPYTRLNAHAARNDTVLTVDSVKGWKVGDEIVISPTTYPSTSQSDKRTIVAVDAVNNRVTIDRGLSYARWGRLQYVTDNGLKLEPGAFQEMRAAPGVSDVLDERAVIIHLTRNIVIEGANDTHWQQGHGVHVMWMGVSTLTQLNGVEVRRAGQAGAIGRYPLHAHMQSYNMPDGPDSPSDGTFVGDAKLTFVRNCVVHSSVNRAIVIHGTCGARYRNNVAFDILGHAFFFEDGSELRNEFVGNVVLNVRAPIVQNRITLTDTPGSGKGSSGLWVSNGWNIIKHNIMSDIRNGPGIWNAFSGRPWPKFVDIVSPPNVNLFNRARESGDWTTWADKFTPKAESWELTSLTSSSPTLWSVRGSISGVTPNATSGVLYTNNIIRFEISGNAPVGSKITFRVDAYAGGCFGLSRNVDVHPMFTPTLDYSNNTAFANDGLGALSDFFPVDELGNTGSTGFISTNDSRPGPAFNNPKRVPTVFDRQVLIMNRGGAYANRVFDPLYKRWICADNRGTDLSGATQIGAVTEGLFIGNSLNNLEPKLYEIGRHAFATYHFSMDMYNLTLMNYPPLPNRNVYITRLLLEQPGAMESWDLYLHDIELGPVMARDWKQFNVTQFERTPPPNIEQDYPFNAGGPDVGSRYWTLSGAIYDAYGSLAGRAGDYIIFNHTFLTHGLSNIRRVGTPESRTLASSDTFYGVSVRKADTVDTHLDPVTFIRLDNNFSEVSRWVIEDGRRATMLGNMRHASFSIGGRYRMFNHNQTAPNSDSYAISVSNANRPNDNFIVGLPWSGSVEPIVYLGRGWNPATGHPYSGDIPGGLARILSPVNSRAELLSTPLSYWRDLATNQLWYHHKGGVYHPEKSIYDQNFILLIRPLSTKP